MRRLLAPLSALSMAWGVACSPSANSWSATEHEVSIPQRASGPDAPAQERDWAKRALRAACDGCRVDRSWEGVLPGSERRYLVARVARGFDAYTEDMPLPRPRPEDYLVETPAGDEHQSTGPAGCFRYDYWVVRETPEGIRSDKVVAVCNDGHGAAGVGIAIVEVGEGRLRTTQAGGSSWRWDHTTTWDLATLALLEEQRGGMWTLGPNVESIERRYGPLGGHSTWYSPPCGAEEREVEASDYYQEVLIPIFDGPPWPEDGWQELDFSACGAALDGRVDGGASAKLTIAAPSVDVLWVAIEDDVRTADDRLELFTSRAQASYDEHCLEPAPPPERFDVVLTADRGETSGLEVARREAPTQVRLRLTLPKGTSRFSLRYIDVDAAGATARVLETSRIAPSNPASLGQLTRIDPKVLACDVDATSMLARPLPYVPDLGGP